MKGPIPIKPGLHITGQPDPEIMRLAERLTELASAGAVAVALVAVDHDGTVTTDWSGTRNSMSLLGGVGLLSVRLGTAIDHYSTSTREE